MERRNSMVLMNSWFERFENMLNEEQMKEVFYGVGQYGLYRNKYNSNDLAVNIALTSIYDEIERMQQAYDKKVENSKIAGRPKQTNDVEIYKLANQGKTAMEIAAELKMEHYKTVYNSDGWKNRKNSNYLQELDWKF